jgi:hypothetical protein
LCFADQDGVIARARLQNGLKDWEFIERIFIENEWLELRATLVDVLTKRLLRRLHWVTAYLVLLFSTFVYLLDAAAPYVGLRTPAAASWQYWWFHARWFAVFWAVVGAIFAIVLWWRFAANLEDIRKLDLGMRLQRYSSAARGWHVLLVWMPDVTKPLEIGGYCGALLETPPAILADSSVRSA